MSLTKLSEGTAPSKEEVYQALLRSLKRRKGFGIVFVQCSPAESKLLIQQVQKDLPQKRISTLTLTQSIDNLYDLIVDRSDHCELNILFIEGLEKSLEAYIEPGYGGEGDYYNIDTVPAILSHLNQRREIFRDRLSNICFVFVLPSFAIKYFIHRAPDFFDWGSGVFEFPTQPETLKQELVQILQEQEESYRKYRNLSREEREQKILEIKLRLQEQYEPYEKAKLLVLEGNLFQISQRYEDSISCYSQALNLVPDYWQAWINQGIALSRLQRYEEAIANFNEALQLKPDEKHVKSVWIWRGNALSRLGQHEEAIANYDEALEHLSYHKLWYNRGVELAELGRYREAVKSYWAAIASTPNYYFKLFLQNPGTCLKTLMADVEEAIRLHVVGTVVSTIFKMAGVNF